MMNEHSGEPAFARPSLATPGDYFALLKPRVMSLVIFTALTGVAMSSVPVNPVIAFAALLAIAVGAGASGAFNMAADADIDARMARTRNRPIPAGRVTREEAFAFAMPLAAGSALTLGVVANWLSAGLLAFTIFFYAVVYTRWLKRTTPQNIVIGGAAGALPPLIGETAMTGEIGIAGLVLFAIIFLWTPPHFWALALVKSDDYARAGVPMMPNVAGESSTRLQILVYTLILAPAALAPVALDFGGRAYALVASLSGAVLVWRAWRVYRDREGAAARRSCWRLFGFSILYLFLLFATLLAERLAGPVSAIVGRAA
ncbi:MAG: heme o synthase [Beijerinckiaceae bacterium]